MLVLRFVHNALSSRKSLWRSGPIFIGLGVAVLAWALSGCKFGNEVIRPESEDKITGFYQTQAQQLNFFATVNHNSSFVSATTNKIPSFFSDSLSNPLAFQVISLTTGKSALYDPFTQRPALLATLNLFSLQFDFEGSGSKLPLWYNTSDCLYQFFANYDGFVRQNGNTPIRGIIAIGRVHLDGDAFFEFTGQCTAVLAVMSACYATESQCGSTASDPTIRQAENQTRQAYVQGIFQLYIDAGAMTAADISNVSAIGYEVSYR